MLQIGGRKTKIDCSVRRSQAKSEHYMKMYGGTPGRDVVVKGVTYHPDDETIAKPRKTFNLFANTRKKMVKGISNLINLIRCKVLPKIVRLIILLTVLIYGGIILERIIGLPILPVILSSVLAVP